MPKARPCRTSRSSSSAASCDTLSSSTNSSWNSSTISSARGIFSERPKRRHAARSCTPAARNRSPRRFSSASRPCSTLRPNSRSLSTATARACGRPAEAYTLNSTPFLKSISHSSSSSGLNHDAMFTIIAFSSVLLPEPVLPASSTCCFVPSPSSMRCNCVAPVRPMGTSTLAAVLAVHTASSAGAMVLKGTCTTDACLAARPTVRSNSCRRLADGGASSVTGSFSRPARSRWNAPSRHRMRVHARSTSASTTPAGIRRVVSRNSSRCTPQRAPLCRMLASRRVALSFRPAGKSAITTMRSGSASWPACAL